MNTLMVRGFAVAVVATAVCATVGPAAAKGKNKSHGVSGVVKTVDAGAGALTVTVTKKKVPTDMDFTVDDAVKVVVFVGADKKEFTGKEGLKNEEVKAGAKVRVLRDAGGKATEVQIGTPPKPLTAKGKIKKVDAAAGSVTVTVKKKKQETDSAFKVEDATKVVIFTEGQKKELTGKDALKDPEVKEGAAIVVVSTPDGSKVTEVRIGKHSKKAK